MSSASSRRASGVGRRASGGHRRAPLRLGSGVLLALLAFPATALASGNAAVGSEPSVAVVELYVKGVEAAAAAEYSRAIAFSLRSTGDYAVMERDDVAARFNAVLITPVRRLQGGRLDDVERLLREGDQLVYTDPKAAIDVLGRARQQLEAVTEGLSANDRLRTLFLRTQMLLARSYLDSGNEGRAADILKDVIRLYGDQLEVTDKEYHPRLVKLFRQVRQGMDPERVASLSVETNPPGCEVLLDGRALPGATPREYRKLYPGTHHVQVRCGAAESMIRRVQLSREQGVSLVIDVPFEDSLTVDGGRLGLQFATPAEAAARAVPFAAKFGALVNADLVALHGFTEPGTRGDLRGWLVDVRKGEVVRQASVPAKTQAVTPSGVKKLVVELTGPAGASRVADLPPATTSGARRTGAPWYRSPTGWVLTAVGVAAIAAGGGLIVPYLDHRHDALTLTTGEQQSAGAYNAGLPYHTSEARKANTYRAAAIGTMAAGGALLAGGIVVFVLVDQGVVSASDTGPDRPRWAVIPAPAVGGGSVLGTVTF
jgi:hypothetical protein